jgi:WD40 repeat protein
MITALAHVQQRRATTATATATTNEDTLSTMLPPPTALTTAFSDGSLSLWILSNKEDAWTEFVLARGGLEGQKTRSITAVDACWISPTKLAIVTASSAGASYYECEVAADDLAVRAFASRSLWASTAVKTVSLRGNDDTLGLLVLLGTAAPRHNRIHVFHRTRIDTSTNENETLGLHYVGGLSGHEDWITCMDWSPATEQSVVLASGSQDARIRLWRFVTTKEDAILPEGIAPVAILMEDIDNEEDGVLDKQAEEEEEEGEARMEIWQSGGLVTRVTLEALLMGHEEMVTDVSWHPSPKITYGEDLLLISSSMDRSIFLWTAGEDGIWTPLSRGNDSFLQSFALLL